MPEERQLSPLVTRDDPWGVTKVNMGGFAAIACPWLPVTASSSPQRGTKAVLVCSGLHFIAM